MKQLKKLSSKLGGLLKLSYISTWGPSPGHSVSSTVQSVNNNSSVANTSSGGGNTSPFGNVDQYGNLTGDQYDDLSQEEREEYLLDRAGRISLDEPEYHQFEKLPQYVTERTFNPYTNRTLEGDGSTIMNTNNSGQSLNNYVDNQPNDMETYMQNPVGPYQKINPKIQSDGSFQSPLIRNNSMSSGREMSGLPQYDKDGKRVDPVRRIGDNTQSLQFQNTPSRRAVGKRQMEHLNAQYLYRNSDLTGDGPNTPGNTTGALVSNGGRTRSFTDPVVNRRSRFNEYLRSRETPSMNTNLMPVERNTGELGSRQQLREGIEGGPVLSVPPENPYTQKVDKPKQMYKVN